MRVWEQLALGECKAPVIKRKKPHRTTLGGYKMRETRRYSYGFIGVVLLPICAVCGVIAALGRAAASALDLRAARRKRRVRLAEEDAAGARAAASRQVQ